MKMDEDGLVDEGGGGRGEGGKRDGEKVEQKKWCEYEILETGRRREGSECSGGSLEEQNHTHN